MKTLKRVERKSVVACSEAKNYLCVNGQLSFVSEVFDYGAGPYVVCPGDLNSQMQVQLLDEMYKIVESVVYTIVPKHLETYAGETWIEANLYRSNERADVGTLRMPLFMFEEVHGKIEMGKTYTVIQEN